MATNFRTILGALLAEQVEFVVVGGVALIARGAPRTTEGIDICYRRDEANLDRLARALLPLDPYLRGAPPGCRSEDLADLAFIAEIKKRS